MANSIVFLLQASVAQRFSIKTFNITNVSLYETGNTEIVVVNPFDKDADFRVRLENVSETTINVDTV